MSEFANEKGESVSRQQAAERLTDIAYALVAGGSLRLDGGAEVTVADEVVLKREARSTADGVAIGLELSWPTNGAPLPAPPAEPERP